MTNISIHTNRPRPHSGGALIIWLLVLGLIIAAGAAAFLFVAQATIRNELAAARDENLQLQQEKTALEQRQAEAPKPVQDATSLELVRLRGEVARLRGVEKQFQQLQAEAQQLRATLQQNQQANAETASLRTQNAQMQNTLQARANMEACVANLKQIAGAKQVWALENKKAQFDVPLDVDIFGKYIPQKPVCPAGGVYNLAPVQAKPTCTVAGHTY